VVHTFAGKRMPTTIHRTMPARRDSDRCTRSPALVAYASALVT
jgi:hypothetical protein